jgi:hypothetical protein
MEFLQLARMTGNVDFAKACFLSFISLPFSCQMPCVNYSVYVCTLSLCISRDLRHRSSRSPVVLFTLLSSWPSSYRSAPQVAQRVTTTLAKLPKPNGLASIHINLQNGQWAGSPRVTLGALGDSFFE